MLFYVVVVLLVSIRFVRAAGSFTFSHTVREAGGLLQLGLLQLGLVEIR